MKRLWCFLRGYHRVPNYQLCEKHAKRCTIALCRTCGGKWHEHWFMCPVFREGFKESASMEECCVFHGENCYDPEPQGTCCPNCPGPAGAQWRSALLPWLWLAGNASDPAVRAVYQKLCGLDGD